MTEKEQRIYYQDIVYAVCNALDQIDGGVIVCGTAAQPSTMVQERMVRLVKFHKYLKSVGVTGDLTEPVAERLVHDWYELSEGERAQADAFVETMKRTIATFDPEPRIAVGQQLALRGDHYVVFDVLTGAEVSRGRILRP